MASNRWVAIDPDILTHPLVGAAQPVPPADRSRGAYSKMEAWLWLICNASFADHTVFNRGRKMTLQRGDLLGGWRFLAHTWNWSSKTVRSWVDRLMADNMLRKRAVELQIEHNGGPSKQGTQEGNYYGNQTQILTVVNYWRFQFERHEEGQPNGQAEGQAKGNQRATHNKGTREQRNRKTNTHIRTDTRACVCASGGRIYTIAAWRMAQRRECLAPQIHDFARLGKNAVRSRQPRRHRHSGCMQGCCNPVGRRN
jgi:hypothetical protein